jgi:hypothetical protein
VHALKNQLIRVYAIAYAVVRVFVNRPKVAHLGSAIQRNLVFGSVNVANLYAELAHL